MVLLYIHLKFAKSLNCEVSKICTFVYYLFIPLIEAEKECVKLKSQNKGKEDDTGNQHIGEAYEQQPYSAKVR